MLPNLLRPVQEPCASLHEPVPRLSCTHSGLAYKVESPVNVMIHPVFHVSALKPYKPSASYQPPPAPVLDVDGELEYCADAVIDIRLRRGTQRSTRSSGVGILCQSGNLWHTLSINPLL
jgi:hypothetical protein